MEEQQMPNTPSEHPINNYIDSALNKNQLSKEDRLNILNFSQKIANNINNISSKEHGIVIAVYGEWGTGKTTAKNALISELKNKNVNSKDKQRILFEFDPWQVPPNENMTKQFITDLHIVTDTRDKIEKFFIDKVMALCIQTYKEPILKLFSYIFYSFLLIIAYKYFISNFIIFKGENIPFFKQGCNLIFLIFLFMLPPILLFVFDKILSTKKPWTTLKETREHFVEKFKNKEVIVIMDDIDRLPKNEIQNVMRLIKSVADFPNIIYVLFCQKDIVQNAVKELYHIDLKESYPNNYLEKIIQIQYYMPKLSWQTLREFLVKDIFSEEIFSNDLGIKVTPALKARFGNFASAVLVQNIKTIRDIKRYVSTFISNIEIFKNITGELIVNIEDLLYLTGLEVFLPETLDEIYNNKLNLLSTNNDFYRQPIYKNYILSVYTNKKPYHLSKFLSFYHNIDPNIVNNISNIPILYTPDEQNNRLFTKQFFEVYFNYFYDDSKESKTLK
jgi:predicted KAP-like P-loop ATPase